MWKKCIQGFFCYCHHLIVKSCLTVLQPHWLSPPSSSVHGIFQAKNTGRNTSPGDLPNLGIEPESPELAGRFLPLSHQRSPCSDKNCQEVKWCICSDLYTQWEKAMAPHSSTLAWKIPWTEEPDGLQSMESKSRTQLHFHFSLSCIGEGNGNPLQCSCLENPKDEGAWRAAVSSVAQSRTRLKRLSSSSSSIHTVVNTELTKKKKNHYL